MQLTIARLREFFREPGAVFWVYGFPIAMIVLLGTAFRESPVERIPVGVQQGSFAGMAETALADATKFKVDVCE